MSLQSKSRKVKYNLFYKKNLESKLNKVDKLNMGAGDYIITGWLNIGIYSEDDIRWGTVKEKNGALIMNYNINYDIPIKTNSIKYIYSSHMIEHLNFNDGIKFLEKCYKILKNDGIIRLVFPDLQLWVKNYYESNNEFFIQYYNHTMSINELPELKTNGEIFMSQIYNWGHNWGYDYDSIKDILQRSGFKDIKRMAFHESQIPNIMEIEPDIEERKLESIYVEVKK
tara:strand:- start:12 stop:689 length:678 start_codon:yes stop_codon:yes gene_type:complete